MREYEVNFTDGSYVLFVGDLGEIISKYGIRRIASIYNSHTAECVYCPAPLIPPHLFNSLMGE